MYPHERSLVQRHAGKPFVFLGVNCDADRETARNALVRERLSKRTWWDGGTDGPIAARWHVEGLPTIYVIDGHGVVRYRHVRGAALDQAVEALLREVERS